MKLYDRKGNPITLEESGRLGQDRTYQILKQTETPTRWWISTVWLFGIDHNYDGVGPPLLFETMVFKMGDDGSHGNWDYDCIRWATEEEAFAGHDAVVAKWSDPIRDARFRLGDEGPYSDSDDRSIEELLAEVRKKVHSV